MVKKSSIKSFFSKIFSTEFNKYLWIDCDAWVNDWSTVEMYFEACKNGKLGITHPYPMMVRDFQSVIGKEVRQQIFDYEKKSGLPESTACIGGGSHI